MSLASLRLGPLHLLGLLTLSLAGGLAWMWFDENAQPRNLVWIAPKPLAPDIKAPAGADRSGATAATAAAFAVILERPVFAPDRRPPPVPPPPAPAPPPDPFATIQIRGIFTGADGGILATVDGKTRRVKVNQAIGNWTLKSINGRDATFVQGEENRVVRLAYARLDAPVPVAAKVNAPTAPVPTSAPVIGPPANSQQNVQDEIRERLRRRNELRTSRGLPPIPE